MGGVEPAGNMKSMPSGYCCRVIHWSCPPTLTPFKFSVKCLIPKPSSPSQDCPVECFVLMIKFPDSKGWLVISTGKLCLNRKPFHGRACGPVYRGVWNEREVNECVPGRRFPGSSRCEALILGSLHCLLSSSLGSQFHLSRDLVL